MKKPIKIKKQFLCLLTVIFAIVFSSVSAVAEGPETMSPGMDEIPYKSYTYWVEYNTSEKTPAYSKPMYEIKKVVSQKELGADKNSRINDITSDENGNIYALDSGNSCVYILNNQYAVTSVVKDITHNGEAIVFKDAKGIFASKGKIYIADTENARVVVVDMTGKVLELLTLPDSELIPTGFKYRPIKIVVDNDGYTYIASDGSYYGAILYSPKMEFLGFFGANTVKATVTDVIKNLWTRLTSNDIKRAADSISLPYTFTDMVLGPNNFIYTSTGRSGEDAIQHGQICRLNPGGKDVLNASDINFADYQIGSRQRQQQVQDLYGLDVDDNGFFFALDATYGRIFWYDSECNLLSIFGGSFGDGNQSGTFHLPSGISVNGTDIVISDSQKNSITVFSRTSYGDLVYKAQTTTLSGDFAAAKDMWHEVSNLDANSQLAYRGLAKAYFDMGDNDNAMKYAKLGVDRDTYAKAFELKRAEFIEKYFVLFFFIAVAVIVILVIVKKQLKKRGIKLIKNEELKIALSGVAHPAESFRLVKEKQHGSFTIAFVLLILFYLVTVLNDTLGGFAFTIFDSSNYNAIYVLLATVGFVFLWCITNWLVCTLAGGIGKFKEIFIVTCYSLLPILFARLLNLVLTHVLIPKEGAFLGIFMVCCTLYSLFMIIIGIMRIHDYEFGKFLGTTIFTIIGMLIIIFLLFLIYLLSQQVFGWVGTLFVELRYR